MSNYKEIDDGDGYDLEPSVNYDQNREDDDDYIEPDDEDGIPEYGGDDTKKKAGIFSKILPFLLYFIALLIAGGLVGTLIIWQYFEEPVQHFIVFGNFGRRGLENQTMVAKAMEKWCEERTEGCDFVVSTGNNFLPTGVSSVTDEQFNESFEWVYNTTNLKKLPFYPVLGENDYFQNPHHQVQYTHLNRSEVSPLGKTSVTETQWKLNDYYYALEKKKVTAFGNEMTTKFVMLDTTPMLPIYQSRQGSLVNRTHLSEREPTEQFKWIKEQLDKPKMDAAGFAWTFVVGHHAIDSTVPYEKEPLIENIQLHLKTGGARHTPIYFCGNGKYVQTGINAESGAYQLLSGAGSRMGVPASAGLKDEFTLGVNSFLYVSASLSKIEIRIVDYLGEERKLITIEKPKTPVSPASTLMRFLKGKK